MRYPGRRLERLCVSLGTPMTARIHNKEINHFFELRGLAGQLFSG